MWRTLLDAIATAAAARTPEQRRLDHEREITTDWLLREQAVGYIAYVDKLAGTLDGVRSRLGYLQELGITYLHLMPLLRARPEPNDGGYAVADYGAVEPALGTMEDLRELADRKSTRLNSSHANISYAVFRLKKKNVPRGRLEPT